MTKNAGKYSLLVKEGERKKVVIYVTPFSSVAALPKGFDSPVTIIPPTTDNHV